MSFWQSGFWASAFWQPGFWQEDAIQPSPFGRRFIRDGVIFDIDEDDEELLMMLAAAAPLLNMRH